MSPRHRSLMARHLAGEELNQDDINQMLRTAPAEVLKTLVFEDLYAAQQLYLALKAPDEVVDYFLDRDDICPSAQRALADRNCMNARRRLAIRDDLLADLRKEFLTDPDLIVRFNIASRNDVTKAELTQLLCDSSPVVVREALLHCTVPEKSRMADYLLGSENEQIRKLARHFIGQATCVVATLPDDEGLGL